MPEIKISIPKYMSTRTKQVELNREDFMNDLKQFVSNVENEDLLDEELYNKIVDYGINKQEFDKMIIELNKFAEYDQDKTYIGFPYEEWIEKLLQIYTDPSIDKI